MPTNSGLWPRHIVINSEIPARCDWSVQHRYALLVFCSLVSDSTNGTFEASLSRIMPFFEGLLTLKQLRQVINELEAGGELEVTRVSGQPSIYRLKDYAVGIPREVQWLGKKPGPVYLDSIGVPHI